MLTIEIRLFNRLCSKLEKYASLPFVISCFSWTFLTLLSNEPIEELPLEQLQECERHTLLSVQVYGINKITKAVEVFKELVRARIVHTLNSLYARLEGMDQKSILRNWLGWIYKGCPLRSSGRRGNRKVEEIGFEAQSSQGYWFYQCTSKGKCDWVENAEKILTFGKVNVVLDMVLRGFKNLIGSEPKRFSKKNVWKKYTVKVYLQIIHLGGQKTWYLILW